MTHGYRHVVPELLSEIISDARKFELYSILSDALHYKKGLERLSLNNSELNSINDEIIFANQSKHCVEEAFNYYSQFASEDAFKGVKNTRSNTSEVEKAMQE